MNNMSIALHRFGLGAGPTDLIVGDAKSWLKEQLGYYSPELLGDSNLPTRTQIVRQEISHKKTRRQYRRSETERAQQARTEMAALNKKRRKRLRRQYKRQVGARVRTALTSDAPFAERLVHFWSNHFAVSADNQVMIGMGGLLELEAIRPHLMGRFEDMLIAVTKHPAMLLYLDQAVSVGPNSSFAKIRKAQGKFFGQNENLGREILELHCLGVRAGYSQKDVSEMALALTGWTVSGLGRGRQARQITRDGPPAGEFQYAWELHEPGARTIMGTTYRAKGIDQALTILSDLAHHPETAWYIATKLARHFIGDNPPKALVDKLTSVFLETGGDLPSLYDSLVDVPESWDTHPRKFRTPWLWGIASLKALDCADSLSVNQLTKFFDDLGQPVWQPGSPAGYGDIRGNWASPDALLRRMEAAQKLLQVSGFDGGIKELADILFGGSLSRGTWDVIAQVADPRDAVTLLLLSPEMLEV